jgi:hypothetical protein
MIRETFALCHLQNAKIQTAYAGQEGGFDIGTHVLEIGGKNKTPVQIKALENGRVLKEGISIGMGIVKPLYLL